MSARLAPSKSLMNERLPVLANNQSSMGTAITLIYLQACRVGREEVGGLAATAAALGVGKGAIGEDRRAVEHLQIDGLHGAGGDAVIGWYPPHYNAVRKAAGNSQTSDDICFSAWEAQSILFQSHVHSLATCLPHSGHVIASSHVSLWPASQCTGAEHPE